MFRCPDSLEPVRVATTHPREMSYWRYEEKEAYGALISARISPYGETRLERILNMLVNFLYA